MSFRCVSLGLAVVMGAGYAMASPLHEVETFGSNPGNLQMFIHVPSDLGAGAPLVVVAHACLQTAHDVAANSGWVELSDTYGFALVFPQTSKDNEPAGGCFRTWQPEHQKRGDGEPLSVGQMVEWMLEHHDLDRDRVFIAGMSSGGLLTGVMLATYPDLFAAGAMLSAYPFKCAGSFEELKPCAAGEKELTAEKWGELVLTGYPEFSGRRPRVSIWHGGADSLILPVNLDLQLEQWTQAAGIDRDPDEVDVIAGNQRRRYNDRTGDQIVETYLIEGMNHAVAVSPNGTPRCGIAAPFFADVDICAALWNARWFGIIR